MSTNQQTIDDLLAQASGSQSVYEGASGFAPSVPLGTYTMLWTGSRFGTFTRPDGSVHGIVSMQLQFVDPDVKALVDANPKAKIGDEGVPAADFVDGAEQSLFGNSYSDQAALKKLAGALKPGFSSEKYGDAVRVVMQGNQPEVTYPEGYIVEVSMVLGKPAKKGANAGKRYPEFHVRSVSPVNG